MSLEPIRVGTRGSLLARTQTQQVLDHVRERCPDARFELVIIQTSGDVLSGTMTARFAGKGFFTKEIEEALLSGAIDLAVHSLKDLPAECPPGLTLAATPVREDPHDALVGAVWADLARSNGVRRIGTSSLRRKSQLLHALPGCQVVNLRGNVDTRLGKVSDGTVDCAVLAAAGLCRLGFGERITDRFCDDVMLPAPGQGALALQIRDGDERVAGVLAAIHCNATHHCVSAERSFMHALGGGCQLPVAALATVTDVGDLTLRGRVLSLDGTCCLDGSRRGRLADAAAVGRALAAELTSQGADRVIAEVEHHLRENVAP